MAWRPRSNQRARKTYKNEDIKAFTIQVVDEEWNNLWTMPRSKALEMAWEQGMDLVQIAYDPKKQVCTAKIVDFGKWQYDKKKAENEKKKKQKNKWQKEIKFGYKIWDHDLDMKLKKWIEFLWEWHVLRVAIVLRGREKIYKELAREKILRAEETLSTAGKSQWVKIEQFWFTLLIFPTSNGKSR